MEKTLRMTLYVGLNDKDSKKQEISNETAEQLIYYVLLNNGLDCTLSMNKGVYTHRESGTVTIENSFKIELLCFDKSFCSFIIKIKKVVNYLKTCLNQESIAVVKEYLNSELW